MLDPAAVEEVQRAFSRADQATVAAAIRRLDGDRLYSVAEIAMDELLGRGDYTLMFPSGGTEVQIVPVARA